ncbi:hypothetical protein ACOSP7_015534 [Xanthoceras sorbifolium]
MRPIWESTVFWDILNLQRHISCFDLILWVFVRAKRAEFEEFCMILWGVWSDRNAVFHSKSPRLSADLVSWSLSLLREFQGTQKVFGSPLQPPRQRCSAPWSPPPAGSLKLNTDTAVKSGFSVMDAVNVVARVSSSFPCSVLDPIVSDVKALFRAVGVYNCLAIPRSGNGMAHSLTSLAFSSKEEFCWFYPEPNFLGGLL